MFVLPEGELPFFDGRVHDRWRGCLYFLLRIFRCQYRQI
jgi:hypothetical protein